MGGVNLYEFGKNGPINILDFYGLKCLTADDCNQFLSQEESLLGQEIGNDILAGVIAEILTGAAAVVAGPGGIYVVGAGAIYGVYDAGSILADYMEQAQSIRNKYNQCMAAVADGK